MKLPLLAAGALLIGTSAIAWVPPPIPPATTADTQASATQVPSDEAVPPTLTARTAPVEPAITDTSEASEVLATPDARVPAPAADVAQYQGTGGPEENVQTGYPPCSRTVTDRCIQLYERGVTGRGN